VAIPNAAILWPIRFATATPAIKVTTGLTTETLTGAATIDRNMWLAGDNAADAATYGGAGDAIKWLQDLLNTNTPSRTYAVAISAAGLVTVTVDTGPFTLHFDDAATTITPAFFGFAASAYVASGSAVSSPNQARGWFSPGYPLSEDTRDRQPYVGSVARTISGITRTSRIAAPHKLRDVSWLMLPQALALAEYGAATAPTGTAEHAWQESLSLGRRLRLYDDAATRTTSSYGIYKVIDLAQPITRSGQPITRFDFRLKLARGDY